jgi:anti-sigma-K factor RskA
MKDNKHIISLIDEAPVSGLSENNLTVIHAHIEQCSDCRQAFQAAQVSGLLLHERAAAEFEPSPFFQTRVMATLRERQAAGETWAWSRLWRAAGALTSSMVATVAALAVLTFAIPGSQVVSQAGSPPNSYSVEELLLDGTAQVEEESDGQLLTTLYSEEEAH